SCSFCHKIAHSCLYVGDACCVAFLPDDSHHLRFDIQGKDGSCGNFGGSQGKGSIATPEFHQIPHTPVETENGQNLGRVEKTGPHLFVGHAAVSDFQVDLLLNTQGVASVFGFCRYSTVTSTVFVPAYKNFMRSTITLSNGLL